MNLTIDSTGDCKSERKSKGKNDQLSELVEINLFYAVAELKATEADASALPRALWHVEQALNDFRAYRTRNEAA